MRLIDADALMAEFAEFVRQSNNSDFAPVPTWNDAVSLVGSMPTIEVVRCGECEHSYDAIGGTFCSYGTCVDCMVDVDFFCKNGERRADDETD